MSSIIKKQVYLDNAASTPIDSRVKLEMSKALNLYGNPSSFNNKGREARKAIENARLTIARFLGAQAEEVIFTSSASESNNMAIFGVVGLMEKGEILTTPIEHPSVLEPVKELERRGWKVNYIKVDQEGMVDLEDFKKRLNSKVRFISIIYANNEIGSIQYVQKIAKIIRDYEYQANNKNYPILHIDACQAAGFLDLNVNRLGADLLTFNGTKIYGPKGSAVLYIRKNTKIKPFIFGGDQERGLRAGTENVSAIVGLAKAVSIIDKKDFIRIAKLRDYFIENLYKTIPDAKINGPIGDRRLPNNVNISIPGVDSENILLELDKAGIYASGGSACTARAVEPSHVLQAIGVEEKYIKGTLRFSLGRQTKKSDIDYALKVLPRAVRDLRRRYKN